MNRFDMTEDFNIIEWVFKGLVGAVVGGVAFFTKNIHSELIKIRDRQILINDDIKDHKLESEKRYAKEETVQFSLSRVHERIDHMNDSLSEKLDRIYQKIAQK